MKSINSWATLSALLLTSLALVIYMAAVQYARDKVGPLMGRGPSVSEEVNLIVGVLVLWPSLLAGLLALAVIVLCWRVCLRREPGLSKSVKKVRIIKLALLLLPLAVSIAYGMIHFLYYLYSR